jgi:hypothetical protein
MVIIGLAVSVVAVVAGLRPHLVSGDAAATLIPEPPAVGDCVVGPVPDPNRGVYAPVTADSGGIVPLYPAQQIRLCPEARSGVVRSGVSLLGKSVRSQLVLRR